MPHSADKLSIKREVRQNHLFSGLLEDHLDRLIDSMHVYTLSEGERLFTKDDPAKQFFFIRKGQIKLYRLSIGGVEKVIHIVNAGDTFAEAIIFMEQHAYPINAETLAPSDIIGFDNAVFVSILRESPDACFRLLADMSIRLRWRIDDIEALSLQNATLRFINYLLQQLPEDSGDGASDVMLSLPKSVVASRLSIQPESFSRILHNLNKIGLINVNGPNIHINDLQSLRNYSG